MIMLNAVEFLREHVPQETRIHYIITNGGSAPNIVPAFAEANLVARNPDSQVLNGIWERIMDCARAGALASGTRMEFEQGTNYANVLPNDTLSAVLGRAMQKAGGYEFTSDERKFAEGAPEDARRTGQKSGTRACPDRYLRAHGLRLYRCRRRELGGPNRIVHYRDLRSRRGRAHLAGSCVCGIDHRPCKGMLVAARTLWRLALDRGIRENPRRSEGRSRRFRKTAGRKQVDDANPGGRQTSVRLRDRVGHWLCYIR